jgi:hypothetical protein
MGHHEDGKKGSPDSPPELQTPFLQPIVKLHGKGNWDGVEFTKGSGPGATERGK